MARLGNAAWSVSLRGRDGSVFGAVFIASVLALVSILGRPGGDRAAREENVEVAILAARGPDTDAPVTTEAPPELPAGEASSRSKSAPPPSAAPAWRALADDRRIATGAGDVEVMAPRHAIAEGAAPPRLIAALHGACVPREWTCARLRDATPEGFLLACPTGNASCEDAPDWTGDGAARSEHVERALGEVRRALALPEPGQTDGDVLIGFSRGGFTARDMITAAPPANGHRFRGVVFLGAAVAPDVETLRAYGVRRVVFAAGELDSSYSVMRRSHARLVASGFASRFVGLGRVYHTLPPDTATRLRDALAWVAEGAEEVPPTPGM